MDLANEIGMDRADPPQELHPAGRLPVRQPVRPAHRERWRQAVRRLGQRAGPGAEQGARGGRLRPARGEEGRGEVARQAPRHRPLHVHRGAASRLRSGSARSARAGRGDVGIGQHPGPPDRQDRRHDGHPVARPGPRDDLLPDRGPRARHPDGGHRRPALGHAGHAVRLRHLRQPTSNVGSTAAIKAAGRSATRPAAMRPTCSKPRPTTSRSSAPSTASRACPTRRRRSRRSPSRSTSRSTRPRAWSRTSTRPPTTTPRTARSVRDAHRVVEIDEETGKVDLVRYLAVDDVGKKINPMIVDGQLHGGIAQARRPGALGTGHLQRRRPLHRVDDGLRAPRASWFPNIELDETVTPSPVNPLGVKGVGEAGTIASTAAVANAVNDALRRSASSTSTCRTRRSRSGPRSRPRREARHDPGRIRLRRPGSIEEAAQAAGQLRREGHRRRPEPVAAHEAAPRPADHPRRHRRIPGLSAHATRTTAERRSGRRPTPRSWPRRSSSGRAKRWPSATSRSATAAPSAARWRMPTLPPMRRRSSWRSTTRPSSARRAASARRPVDGFFTGPFTTTAGPTRSSWPSVARRFPMAPGRTRSCRCRRPGTRSSASRWSSRAAAARSVTPASR